VSVYVRDGVVLAGWAAFAIARLLAGSGCRQQIEDMPPGMRAPIEDAIADLQRAGQAWQKRHEERDGGPAAPVRTALPLLSETDVNAVVTTEEASALLDVGTRYVRKLIDSGVLPARRERGRWLIDRAAVLAHQEKVR
jgi:excisionase family DNA binding protein